jgi:hypothetical protein
MVNISTPSTGTDVLSVSAPTVAVYTDDAAQTALTCTATTITTNIYVIYTCPVTTSAAYRLYITQANTPDNLIGTVAPSVLQLLQFTATSYLTASGGPNNSSAIITTLVKASDTFRDRITRLIYIGSNENATFSLYPAPTSGSNYISIQPPTFSIILKVPFHYIKSELQPLPTDYMMLQVQLKF